VKEFVSNHKFTFFCITPANRDFIQGNFGSVDDRLEEKLHERYQWLVKNGIDLQLHVHTSLLSSSGLAFQKRLITAAKDWMNRWGFAPSDVALGWFKRDPETESIVREVGLRLVKEGDYFFLHDYEIAKYLRGDIDWQ